MKIILTITKTKHRDRRRRLTVSEKRGLTRVVDRFIHTLIGAYDVKVKRQVF